MKSRYIPRHEALEKARRYCAYQDRSHQEVWEKLKALNQEPAIAEELIAELVEEGFLDEERFACSYARGKFKHNRWGRQKIRQGLKQKGIQPRLIQKAMEEIEDEAYQETLYRLLHKKLRELAGEDYRSQKTKVARYLTHKGYEQGLVWKAIDEVLGKADS
jgi:regulatory protein